MALGKGKEKQIDLFIPATKVVKGSGYPFYCQLNEVLEAAKFDDHVEELCRPFYKECGRPGVPPGVYFRMLFILVPQQMEKANLLHGKAFGIDATTLEANAAMKSIVRRDNGKDWEEYLRELAAAEGMENHSMDDLRRLDRKRKGKKTSNKEWQSGTDPDSRITKMKDGRTHLAYKAEHSVQLESQAIVSACVTEADRGHCATGLESAFLAQANLMAAGSEEELKELVADKGYHGNAAFGPVRGLVGSYLYPRTQAAAASLEG